MKVRLWLLGGVRSGCCTSFASAPVYPPGDGRSRIVVFHWGSGGQRGCRGGRPLSGRAISNLVGGYDTQPAGATDVRLQVMG